MLRWFLAALHLLALGIGLPAIWLRARLLRDSLDGVGVRRVLAADAWWGIAAALLLGTGLWRWLAGLEKPAAYYNHNHIFWIKMALLVIILALEVWPMITFIRWRAAVLAGKPVSAGTSVRGISLVGFAQAGLVVLMLFAATAIARGYGMTAD